MLAKLLAYRIYQLIELTDLSSYRLIELVKLSDFGNAGVLGRRQKVSAEAVSSDKKFLGVYGFFPRYAGNSGVVKIKSTGSIMAIV